ncbi:sodium/glutamate symporter [Clostridium sp. CCUG 7971]|uniref:sodium/glutamate symporter n=1 Tax=Clostridium sp. CCUG 7971 TaxID=2811414 RepID=UPI001ABBAC54|nr:sodium/glutamate symporter [Clostridium sp. CCUG 7971]MBO3445839.1 sodium/glutamate symporter [Clostridium sp. CCUG 7971]
MSFEVVDGLRTINLDMIATVTLASLMLLFGNVLKKKITILEKFCIPGPVIGGLLVAIIVLILKTSNILNISMDTTLQSPFMITFFTTIGLGASFALVKKGGKLLIVYWLLCGVLSVSQNLIGVIGAKLTGIDPLIGVMCGAVSMEGGHGAAASFGATVESLGVTGAATIGMAAATFGVVCGGLIGGPISRYLIDKNKLKPTEDITSKDNGNLVGGGASAEEVAGIKISESFNSNTMIMQITVILSCMTIGTVVSLWFTNITDVVLPGYVGAMFIAVIFRNLNDKLKLVNLDLYCVDIISNVCLAIFLTMALMTMKLWELADLAGPMIIIVVAQVAFIALFGAFVVFRLLGKNFDAAIMVAGFLGHGLGATPNALANINSVTSRYGNSTKAMLIVPLVGAFLIDLVAIPTIVTFINFFS